MSRLAELKEKRDHYYQELEDLHLYEPSEQWYKMRRYEIESQIAFIEDAIDELEKELKLSTHLKVIMLATTIIVGTAVLIILLWS